MTYEYKFMGSENTAVLITDGLFTTIDRGMIGALPDQFAHWGSENTAIRVRDGKLVTCNPSYVGVTGDQYAHVGEENNALTVRDGCIVASAAGLVGGVFAYIHLTDRRLPVLTLRGGVLVGGYVASDITYLLRDEFTTAQAAPLTSPRTCEPGPGTLTITDSSNQLSIATGVLLQSGTPATGFTDPRVQSTASFARVVGRALLATINLDSPLLIGWVTSASGSTSTALYSFFASNAGANVFALSGTNVAVSLLTAATNYQIALVLIATGCYFFIKGGTEFPAWALVFYDPTATTTPLFSYQGYSGAGSARKVDSLRITDLPAPFSTNALATLTVASPSGDYTGTADQLLDITETSPAALGVESGVRYRVVDANNYWRAYFDATGQFKLDSVVAGVATNRITVAAAISTSQTRTIRVVCKGNTHDCYTLASNIWTKRGGTITNSTHAAATGITTDTGLLWTATNLISIPTTSPSYNALSNV